ncbi:TetR/AcrR family transcriptional regulator [Nocardioides sp. URHA0020]|uniref:TetR/AcrR family transcriptional regulator n=1 Tax=Nocardioides sp. URHA0020 TaxID=1380392 RepID=UPI000568893C|nr:TetR/AcrR family transcriptional regulator [Nocardioides sp. URHA0020]
MTSSEEPPRRGRGRPRAPGAEEKILQAALEEYTEHGWAGFTMDGVARRAGFGKSTLYLRWPDKDALLTDAVRLRSRTVAQVDTGSFSGDLTALATAVFREFTEPQGWAGFRMVIDSASASVPLGQFTREVSGVHRDVIEGIFERGRGRGELLTEVEPLALTDLIYGAALFYTLGCRLDHAEITDAELTSRVDNVVSVLTRGLC